jgi:fumarylacetoacetase
MAELNDTHDPARRSWVESANAPDTEFPIQNLPFCVFQRNGEAPRGGVAIGDRIFDVNAGLAAGLFSGATEDAARAAAGSTLNSLFALGNGHASALRARLSDLLRADGVERKRAEPMAARLLVPIGEATLHLPAAIGDFTDFLTSLHHTKRMSPSGNDHPPSFKTLPIAYHSRSSSVRAGGEVIRPHGQHKAPDGTLKFGPEPSFDFELELGTWIGEGNALGAPVGISQASRHIFGYCLVNDWSSRATQRWESTPLGPFLGKSVSTTVSPFVVTAEAMAPFRAPAPARDAGDEPLPYLVDKADQSEGGLDLDMEAYLLTGKMRGSKTAPHRVTRTTFRNSYWTFAQMLTHHASNGCNLRSGDLLASGTVSGPEDGSRACLAEATSRGTKALELPGGEKRTWLEDGDEVIFRARASRAGFVSIGFGECRGRVAPAVAWKD